MVSAFSVDVEDGVSIAMRDRFGKRIAQTDRVVHNTRKILAMLAETGSHATFFILGQVVESFPQLVREISEAGHELGVHGYDHLVFKRLDPDSARLELSRAKRILEDVSGQEVLGHRAPCFSIDPDTSWALDVLIDVGFAYDSSIVPGRGFGYGWPGQRLDIGPVRTPQNRTMLEVPLSVISVGGLRVPVLGGSYFRLLPYALCRRALHQVEKSRPAIVYLHPYELDSEPYPDYYFAEMKKASLLTQFRMRSFWLRRGSLAGRYSRLLRESKFCSIRDFIEGPMRASAGSGFEQESWHA